MKLELTKRGTLELKDAGEIEPGPGYKKLKVLYCAVCRTDAKMWAEGHRDLALPRTPGHEIAALDEASGALCTVWPGKSCGYCEYCISGRENLCESMKIIGFHRDGGFADYVLVPEESILPVKRNIRPHLLCFAEPVGCVLHGLGRMKIKNGDRVIIYGGGTLGLIIALVCKGKGALPLIIEKDEEKISHTKIIREYLSVHCVKDTFESDFDHAINACADISAFSRCLTKLKKGGKLCYFSGLNKNEKIETNIANLIHYRENTIVGSYGLLRKDMIEAIDIIAGNEEAFELLIEEKLTSRDVPGKISNVLSGMPLKYIIDFTSHNMKFNKESCKIKTIGEKSMEKNRTSTILKKITGISEKIVPVSEQIYTLAWKKINNKTKPLGSLGKLEKLAVQLSTIKGNLTPSIKNKSVFVFAGDHGVAEEGVSAFPAEVTGQMVENFLDGGAAINVLCKNNGIDLAIIDAGVNKDFDPHPLLIEKKIRKGTRNFALEKAMTAQEAQASIEMGIEVFFEQHLKSPIDIIGLGEMGIGNTTAATAIISAVTGVPVAQATGRGTGVDDKGIERKIETIEKVLRFHKPDSRDPFDILEKIGGYEIGGIAGAVLAAASKRTAVVLDGIISTAAGLVACLINPHVKDYLVSGHKSVEIGQKAALEYMGIEPVLDLDMRLGEGTGAALTIGLVDSACAIMRDMASFEEAQVSGKTGE